MTNNDILLRLRYAFDLKNKEVAEIFALGGAAQTLKDIGNMLIKVGRDEEPPEYFIAVTNDMLEAFLNGFITYKRGPQPDRKPAPVSQHKDAANNMLLKKVKIALSFTSEDVLDVLDEGGVAVSKGEIGAILRNPSHRNYQQCGDRFARCFLKGLTYRYREDA